MNHSYCQSIQDFVNLYHSCPACQSNLNLAIGSPRRVIVKNKKTIHYLIDLKLAKQTINQYIFINPTENIELIIDISLQQILSQQIKTCYLYQQCPKFCFRYESLSVNTNQIISEYEDNFLFIEKRLIFIDSIQVELKKVYYSRNETNCFINGKEFNFAVDTKWWYLTDEQLLSKINNIILLS